MPRPSSDIRFEIERVKRLLPWLDRIGQEELAAYRRRQLPRLEQELKQAEAWEYAMATQDEEWPEEF